MGERAQQRDDDLVTVLDANGNETQMTRADARAAGLKPIDSAAPDASSNAQPTAESAPQPAPDAGGEPE